MTTPFLFSPPPKYYLPLSLGGDLVVDFQNNPSGDEATFVNYASGVSVTLIIDTTVAITAAATVSGYHANVLIPNDNTEATTLGLTAGADSVPAGTGWRLIVATTTPATEIVAAYGTVKRFDG